MILKHEVVKIHFESYRALHFAANQIMDNRVKHIDIRYNLIIHAVPDKILSKSRLTKNLI